MSLNSRSVSALSIMLLGLVMSMVPGCGMTVTPPALPARPVCVFIADHGVHSSLLIPRDDGRVAQFAFSQWEWAALDQDEWYRALPALLMPGAGTLGTRDLESSGTYEDLLHHVDLTDVRPPVATLYEIKVGRAERESLLAWLDERWRSQSAQKVLNQRRAMWFVPDHERYSLGHNCNTEVAEWLRRLGCTVSGSAITADFDVRVNKEGRNPSTREHASE